MSDSDNSDLTLVPMTQAQFEQYLPISIAEFAQDKIDSGQWARADALALAQQSMAESLPQGLVTPDIYLFGLEVGPARQLVGMIWINAQVRGDRRVAYVYDVMVYPAHRRQGHATRAFAAIEKKSLELGLSGVALHVFGHNPQAHALYVKLGFVTTNINMFKALS